MSTEGGTHRKVRRVTVSGTWRLWSAWDGGNESELVGILKEVGVVVRNGSKAGCLRWLADWKELEELDEAGEGG